MQEKGRRSLSSSPRRYTEVEAKMSEDGDFKNNDLHRIRFDRTGNGHYYTRPMAPGLPDRVDCAHLADESAVLERVYPLGELPRLQDLLEDARGSVRANFAFAKLGSGRVGATVTVEANLRLVCQRCMRGFAFPAAASSEIEFSAGTSADAEREVYSTDGGLVSLRELAEEELLLALPIVPMHPPQECDWAPIATQDDEISEVADDRSRPFAALQALLKKT
jgi:uncharacterized protein